MTDASALRSELFQRTYDAIRSAQSRLQGRVLRTALKRSESLSAIAGAPVFLKLENTQTTGAFKLRGATNAILSLNAQARQKGVVTASTGNHGRAVAHAAKALGVRAVICLSALVPANKVDAIRALGAEVHIVGRSQDEAQEEVERLVRREGLAEVSPFDDSAVIAGQGTIGLEIVEDLPGVDCVLVPLSGGGLAAGIAVAVKAQRPQARVVGITMAHGAAMHESIAAGHPVAVEETESLADSLGGGIGLENRFTFPLCRDLLDDTVLLSEDEIAAGIRHAFLADHEVVEGGAAVGVAALLAHKVKIEGPTVTVLSGRNIDPVLHSKIVGDKQEAEPARQGAGA
jgi:threonine dehydratase